VILPLTVQRRVDCVLARTKQAVLDTNARLRGRLENLDAQLQRASGHAFFNTSLYDFERLCADASNVAANLRAYIAAFSPNMREVLEKFDFDNTISRLDEAGLLFLVLERFKAVDLHPDKVSNHDMGTIFEELIRRFNEALNENPGEHFTPRDVVRLMAGLLLAGDADKHAARRFDYLLTNPPYGKDWNRDREAVEKEARNGYVDRFGAGTPRISDGQLLFLQHLLGRMKDAAEGGSRVVLIMNGSPLFTGDAGSGESDIRRWVLEHDWLEAIVALPEQLFYNTGIATYVWVLANRKEPRRAGVVQLIDAAGLWTPMRKSLGDKRRAIAADHMAQIIALFEAFEEGERGKIFPASAFGYRKITVERPLRLNFCANAERIARLRAEPAFVALALSKKADPAAKAQEEALGRDYQARILRTLQVLGEALYRDRAQFEKALDAAALQLTAPIRKAILSTLSERDVAAEICRDKAGNPEPDPELRDTENVPLGQEVFDYFEREVRPHVPDAWVNRDVRDKQDGEVGKVGCEINFNRYFYTYTPPRPLAEIESDIRALEGEIMAMLRELAD
jgi:type I restriction enzyme M protein